MVVFVFLMFDNASAKLSNFFVIPIAGVAKFSLIRGKKRFVGILDADCCKDLDVF